MPNAERTLTIIIAILVALLERDVTFRTRTKLAQVEFGCKRILKVCSPS